MRSQSAQWLLQRIEQFIAKYYRSRLIKGLLIVSGCILLYYLILIIGEYFFYFRPWIKIPAIVIPGLIGLFTIIKYILIPLFQMQKIGKRISEADAAKIIGDHFPEIKDKLLNVLQLSKGEIPEASRELIEASIDQKSQQLAPFQFTHAVNIKEHKKWLPLALIPIAIGMMMYFFNPGLFRQSNERLLNPTAQYSKPAPFTFHLLNEKLEVMQFADFPVRLELMGEAIPTVVNLIIGAESLPMIAEGGNIFSFTIKKIDKNQDFKFEAVGYFSETYSIQVLQKPGLNESKILISYPGYTGRPQEEILGLSDLTVPQGSTLLFKVKTKNTKDASIVINEDPKQMQRMADNEFQSSIEVSDDFGYYLYLQNFTMPVSDESKFVVQVIKDQPPQIDVKEHKEKITGQQVVLTGNASDDYGLSKASFLYTIVDAKGKTVSSKTIPLSLTGKAATTLQYYFDMGTLGLSPGQKVVYYMEVWDNDAVNGSKVARSQLFEYKTVGYEETEKAIEENNEALSKALSAGKDKMKELEEQIKKMQENSLQDKEMTSWEQKQNLDLLQEQQDVFKEKLQDLEKRMEHQKELMENKEYNEQIQEKQDAVQQQIDNLLNKELNEQMKKLQDLLQKKGGEMKMQELQKMQQENSLFQMDMERIEAMIKQLEMQMKMEDVAKKIDALVAKQEQLEQKTTDNTSENAALEKEQNAIKNELQQMMDKDMEELKKMADDHNLSNESEAGQDAEESMQESEEQLNQDKNQQSKKSQKNAINKLQKMSKGLMEKAAGMDMEQLDLDIKATRQLLTNLLRLSFDQEDLMEKARRTSTTATTYKDLVRDQFQLKKSSVLIKDSLFALSKRIVQLGPTINKETMELESKLSAALSHMEDRNVSIAGVNQQYAMTSSNNLALLLNELLSNLLQQQASMEGQGEGEGKGQGQGKGKKGKGKGEGQGGGDSPGGLMKDIISGQKQVGKGFNQLRKEGQGQGKDGKGGQGEGQQGDGQSGQQGGQGQVGGEGGQGGSGNGGSGNQNGSNGNSTAETLSRMAYEQAKLRQQVQQLNSIMNSKGIKGNAQIMREIQEQMDRMETDLINRKTGGDLEKRQNEILTRLLKAEEAIREQEQDNKRQGEQAIERPRPIPPELQKHIDELQKMKEMYRTTPPELKPYYKKITDRYLEKVSS